MSIYPVTDDATLNAELVALDETAGTHTLWERVRDLGLTPPGHPSGASLPGVSVVWTADMDADETGIVAWDIGLAEYQESDRREDA